ncbi:5-methyltetrahydropteroyltriglutamate--homocysteine S-methyltransferase [Thermoflexibacter ruber]|uniref:5-methyltetrahydropteroyltriglutamate--homocysteine methyltransferase n=1 Tax=Thermoflexibacter ruber TaxID=1003 RepID=A0A1I2AAV2_9BACT|nr:5-methyltetrahydropteroyltriglutamate--homocysteine S-methyltransferase [Thermoflexibacter ruber]SFE40992.1 methionine synthase (B12-independent) [Thermoflexibacter ruber]
MQNHNLGYPRIGSQRELKKACEAYWTGKILLNELLETAKKIRTQNWQTQQTAGIELIPVNDFSFYDQVLDMSLLLGNIPDRYQPLRSTQSNLDLYFAMARGYQRDGYDLTAMEMTKWFDTNYHYIVPEFKKNQTFQVFGTKVFEEFAEAKNLGFNAKPVLIGAVSYLLLGKEKDKGFSKLDVIDQLLPVYIEILQKLQVQGAVWVQIDEPYLAMDLTDKERQVFVQVYTEIKKQVPQLKIILANYFDCYGDNLATALQLPLEVLHLDLVRCPSQLDDILTHKNLDSQILSLGIVDGRNIWKNDFEQSLQVIQKAVDKLGKERVWIAPSCSLLHSPYDLDFEQKLNPEIKQWLAFAKQKLNEVVTLTKLAKGEKTPELEKALQENIQAHQNRKTSTLIHNPKVKERLQGICEEDFSRQSSFVVRQALQKKRFKLPLFPTTTIGSFPQTTDVRQLRARWKKGELTQAQYEAEIEKATLEAISWQEEVGLDVLVHGEFERNDMVEYFGELLEGFAFTENGWVQSYGSRCVKPPIIFGDVARNKDLSVRWSSFAQKHTKKLMKGMLTGPVTILQWSFVRNDQARKETAFQIALAIRDEVIALEQAGIQVIQIDEPAIREGLPLGKKDWTTYLDWAVKAFRLAASGVKDETQIHTHMCYSEFNDIIEHIAAMDADVITIETSRSAMELLNAFTAFKYPNEIGPGVYDIHSPRVPSVAEIKQLLNKATEVLPLENIWVNPDCGLKTRRWEETKLALQNMVQAAQELREEVSAVKV